MQDEYNERSSHTSFITNVSVNVDEVCNEINYILPIQPEEHEIPYVTVVVENEDLEEWDTDTTSFHNLCTNFNKQLALTIDSILDKD